jgi:hypothetical protein
MCNIVHVRLHMDANVKYLCMCTYVRAYLQMYIICYSVYPLYMYCMYLYPWLGVHTTVYSVAVYINIYRRVKFICTLETHP